MPSVLITGGSRGIGLALCHKFAALGWDVWAGLRWVHKWPSPGIKPLLLTVNGEESIKCAANWLQRNTVTLSLLINNAAEPDWVPGGASEGALTISPTKWLGVYRANVLGPLLVTRAMLPLMAKGARVVNVMSGVGEFDNPRAHEDFQIAYAASKSALLMTTFKLAAALQPYGIFCNAACPDWCRTEMGGNDAPHSAEFGAESIIKACFLGVENPPTGKYFRNGQEVN